MKFIDNMAEIEDQFSPGQTIVMHSGFADPAVLSAQLAANASSFSGLSVYTLMPMGDVPYADDVPAQYLNINNFFPGPKIRKAINRGAVKHFPSVLSEVPGVFNRREVVADFLFLQLSSADDEGHYSLGLSVDYMRQVLDQNPMIVAEINPRVPHTLGNTKISGDQIDYAIAVDYPPVELVPSSPDEVEKKIARHIAGLLRDGAILQFGIGAIPDQTLAMIGHLNDVGVHTGLLTEPVMPLIRSGVITNATKNEFKGQSVAAFAGGSSQFYDFLDRNPSISMQPTSYTHNPDVISRIDNLFAINSVLQIDITGQCNVEKIAGKTIAGPGGLPDFAKGATASKGGASIIAMRSATRDENQSNILQNFSSDTPISIDASLIDFVVTEYGVAAIRGKTPAAIASALTSIAHPKFRDALEAGERNRV